MRGETPAKVFRYAIHKISIHSPHAGRDATFAVTPVVPPLFQSTLPMRGETEYSGYVFEYNKHFNPLSPCGERLK